MSKIENKWLKRVLAITIALTVSFVAWNLLQKDGHPHDPVSNCRAYANQGDALRREHRSEILTAEVRLQILKPYLQALRLIYANKVPEHPGPLPGVDGFEYGGSHFDMEYWKLVKKHDAQWKKRKLAELHNDLAFLRNTIKSQIAEVYRRTPGELPELTEAARQELHDPVVVNDLLESVKRSISPLMLSGRVMDSGGKPISNARIFVGPYWANTVSSQHGNTDEKGDFRILGVTGSLGMATIQAGHFSPEVVSLTFSNGLPPLRITLQPGRVVRGKVIDLPGKPVAGARIEPGTWKGIRTLRIGVLTDAQGEFVWDSAPPGPLELTVESEACEYTEDIWVTSGEAVNEIRLRPKRYVTIKVLDADTKTPISAFHFHLDSQDANHGGNGSGREPIQTTEGIYRRELAPWRAISFTVGVDADGYIPQEAEPITRGLGDVTRNFELKRAK